MILPSSFFSTIFSQPLLVALISALLSAGLLWLYRTQIGQRMVQRYRDAGPEHHKKKGAVPTGAGITLVLLLFACGVWAWFDAQPGTPSTRLGIYVCWAAALAGLLGFVDDGLKARFGSTGLKARYKFPVMILIGLGLLYLISSYFVEWHHTTALTATLLPWPVETPWWLFYPVGLFVWLGALNGANFTDGLDGLLAATTLVVLGGAFYALLDGTEPLAAPAAVGLGVLTVFMFYNWKPASLYMGDSGSLAVGALIAGLFLAKGWWLFLGLAVVVWVLNVLSVILQVLAYRLTGKRLLLMSPLQHHFELAGWGERTIVLAFTGLQILGCITAFIWLRYGVSWGLALATLLAGIVAVLLLKYHRRVR